VIRHVRDQYLPPDHAAFLAAEPPTGRVIVIAPTRAACETIELALGLHLETFLEKQHGPEVRALAGAGKGFGIVAGTGTGKTLAIRPIAESILRTTNLRVGVINREREATPETPTWNVIIVTTGIARRWFQDGDILPTDTLIVDEIHQTSAELELCLALGKKVGARFIWLSATVDPTFYARYLDSAEVIESSAFDPTKAAKVEVLGKDPIEFLDDRFLQQVQRQERGVAVFLPTRAGVEQAAAHVQARFPRINAAFYHGGEPIRIIRPFLEGEETKPYVLAMTAAGQSALNVRGLDTVIIDDRRFTNIIDRGRNVLTQLHLGANEILQMAGRVHGRVEGGRVFILSDRDIDFGALRPTEPDFQLAGDSERVAITCADLGVRADDLDLPVPLDRVSYKKAVTLLQQRNIIQNGRLSEYGKAVEAMPVDRPWAELLVHADDDIFPYVAVMSSVESLHRMTREDRNLEGLIVPGSDHLTAYNVYAEAFKRSGYLGEVYGLPRHLFDESVDRWAEERGVLVKALEDIALGMASVYRSANLPLPTSMPFARDHTHRRFADLLAQIMPFDLVIDEETADGQQARVSKTSVCGSWGAIAGELRYFADKFGNPRASIEGTQIPMDLLMKYATRSEAKLVYEPERKRAPLSLVRRVEYNRFELEREVEALDRFPPELQAEARRVLAESLARFEARHPAAKRNQHVVDQIRETYRRSGGRTPRLGLEELTSLYEAQMAEVHSIEDFRRAYFTVDADRIVPREERERWLTLPDAVVVRDRDVDIHYDVEEQNGEKIGVARLRLPEKMARTLTEEELPRLDRPLRFVVTRGQRGAVRANTLDELQELLDRPWTPEELEATRRQREEERAATRDERRVREIASEFRRDRKGGGWNGRRRGTGGRPQRDAGQRHDRGGRPEGHARPGSPTGRGKRRRGR
jgi:ATP-dependent RNA helicase HrpA